MTNLKYLCLTVLTSLILTSCVVTSDDDDPPSPDILEMTISAEVTKLSVYGSCEGDGTSGTADIMSRFMIYLKKDWDAPLEPIDSTDWELVQLGRGTSLDNPGISGSVDVNIADENRIVIYLETFEGDAGGVKDFEKRFYFNLGYQSDQGCWTDKVWGDCHPDSPAGTNEFDVPMHDMHLGGDRCRVDYNWRVKAELI